MIDYLHAVSGLLVGVLVGMTGVGGGSLMAPIMILLLGVAPTTAVGTDLWFAAITKAVGGVVHHKQGHADWQIVRRLAYGSIPAVVMTIFVMHSLGAQQSKTGFITNALGIALVLTALATFFRKQVRNASLEFKKQGSGFRDWQAPLTVFCGAILGVTVTLTSVGAGALGTTMILMLYPLRLTTKSVVGTDIVHAIPLAIAAGIGHLWIGNVDFELLLALLVGSIPGIIVGSLLAGKMSERVLQVGLALILAIVGTRLVLS